MAFAVAPRLLAVTAALALLGSVLATRGGAPEAGAILGAVLGLVAAAGLLGIGVALPAPRLAALAYDVRLRLHERLSSALDLPSATDLDMRELQRNDAIRTAASVTAAQAYPLRARRRDVLGLALAAGLLAAWWALPATHPLVTLIAGPVAAEPATQDSTSKDRPGPGQVAPPLSPQQVAELQQLRAALSELRAQLDPDAARAGEALQSAADELRRSAEARAVGRALDDRDLRSAVAELRSLASQIAQLNDGQMAALAEAMRAAAQDAGADPALGQQLQAAAEALERNRIADARKALERLAQEIGAIGAGLANNRALEQQIAALERQLAAAGAAGQQAPGALPGAGLGEGASSGAAQGEAAGAGPTGDGRGPRGGGGLDSSAQGRELPALLETLPANARLNASGSLEVVELTPEGDKGPKAQRPVLELGTDTTTPFEPSAGARAFAVGRPDVSRSLPLDLQPLLDRYFTSPKYPA
ncbi:MAG: hypothetical protein FJ029_07255 [Actinobacteria bacterium]|nr:hypothetical protein [Actinomycetota bacterium]